ncbi:hypothetical protein Tco_0806229 [Tanacetum coccineum]|uniref:Uncharacterized protein n=1 Tax=Tanacetum coccineum TaxID=301880 RepID=A0ABQ5CWP3_9ASTR
MGKWNPASVSSTGVVPCKCTAKSVKSYKPVENKEVWKEYNHLYNMYYTKYGSHQTQSTTAEGSSSQKSRDPLSRMVHGLTQHKQKKARGDPIMSSEYEQYIKTDFVRGLQPKDYESYDVLGFWKQGKISFLFYPAWPWIFKWSKLLR